MIRQSQIDGSNVPGGSRFVINDKDGAASVNPSVNLFVPSLSPCAFCDLTLPQSLTVFPAHTLTMRIFSFLPALAALVTAVVAGTVPTDDCSISEFGCPIDAVSKRSSHPSRSGYGLTNAELLRRGLPLRGPVLRRGAFAWLQYIALFLLSRFEPF
jgi:hypothetical protein